MSIVFAGNIRMLNKRENTGVWSKEPPEAEGRRRRLKSGKALQRADSRSVSGCPSGSALVVRQLGRFKDGRLIAPMARPDSIDNAHPAVGEGAHRHAVALAFRPLALVVAQRPTLTLNGLPGELMQRIAQGLQAGVALVGFGIVATSKGDGHRSRQGLHTGTGGIAAPIIAPFGQEPWSQAFARTRQPTKEMAIRVRQKKAADLLVIGGDLLHQRKPLAHQCQHQPRLGARGDTISRQMGLMQALPNGVRGFGGSGMPAGAQRRLQALNRGRPRLLRRWTRLQEDQRCTLVQWLEQLQGDWVVRFETGGELVRPAGSGSGSRHPDRG